MADQGNGLQVGALRLLLTALAPSRGERACQTLTQETCGSSEYDRSGEPEAAFLIAPLAMSSKRVNNANRFFALLCSLLSYLNLIVDTRMWLLFIKTTRFSFRNPLPNVVRKCRQWSKMCRNYFLGHISVHRQHYRLLEATLQRAKICKVLLALEYDRLGEYKGKSLDEIQLEVNS